MKSPLREYQLEASDRAVAALKGGGGFGLWPEPRCGKTIISLSIVEKIRPAALLVVCPLNAIPVWQDHLRRELNLRALQMLTSVTNYEQLVAHRKVWYDWAREHSRLMVICDESHCIKQRGASRSRVTRHIAGFAKYRLALTGTPIAQGLQDAWSQFDFIDPTIFGTWEEFDRKHLVWGGYKKHQIVRYRNKKTFDSKFHENSYRITLREAKKEQGQTLLLHYSKQRFDLGSKSRRIYEQLKIELQTEVDRAKVKVKNVLSCCMKLQQVTGGFLIGQDDDENPIEIVVGQEKLEKLHEVVRSQTSRIKFIVVCRFRWEIHTVQAFLRKLGYHVEAVYGGSPYDGKFNCDALVLQIQSGVAVDMSQADHIIYYSADYSQINREQSRFRILSYDKPAARYSFLLARDTIDELIYEAVSAKKNFARLVIDTFRSQKGSISGGRDRGDSKAVRRRPSTLRTS